MVQEIMDNFPSSLFPHTEQKDFVIWTLDPHGIFSIKSAWKRLQQPHPEVFCWKSVWFKLHVPRWAIIQWLAVWGRLSTKDRFNS